VVVKITLFRNKNADIEFSVDDTSMALMETHSRDTFK